MISTKLREDLDKQFKALDKNGIIIQIFYRKTKFK